MPVPSSARFTESVRYDAARGSVLVEAPAHPDPGTEYADAQAVAGVLSTTPAAAVLAVYGLVLVAHTQREWPSESRLATIIQAGERFRQACPYDHRTRRAVAAALGQADAAILAGADVEAALLAYAADEARRADRANQRCGKVAAKLLDDHDHLLADGMPGGALVWVIAAARDEQKQVAVTIPAGNSAPDLEVLIRGTGAPGVIQADAELVSTLDRGAITVHLLCARHVALDGSVLAEPGMTTRAALARQRHIPVYVLAPEGPDPDAATAAAVPGTFEVLSPDQVSAIATSRGLYRADMISRYWRDQDAPLDVIPLG